MYKATLTLFFPLLFSGCETEENTTCDPIFCTMEFRMIGISFTDKDGKPAAARDFHAINQRTGDTINYLNDSRPNPPIGYFVVITDADRKQLSAEGDDIKVTATSEATGQAKSAILKVAGGKCACHIGKISGPETVAFD